MKQAFVAAAVMCSFGTCCQADVVTPPNSPPPQMVIVQRIDTKNHTIRFVQWESSRAIVTTVRHYQKKAGAEVPANVPLTTSQLTPHEHEMSWNNLRLLNAKGRPIAGEEAWRGLQPGEVVFLATDPKGVDLIWRKALAHKSVILVPAGRASPRPVESSEVSPPTAAPGK